MTAVWPDVVRLRDLANGPVRREFIADAAARAAIAEALGLVSLDHLEATATVAPWLDGAELSARWRATATQACVVTLDPLRAELQGEFRLRLLPIDSPAAPRDGPELNLDPQEEDPPDLLETDQVDVGAYVVEHLALELDPFPRTPGAQFEPPDLGSPESPFAALRNLKPGKPGG